MYFFYFYPLGLDRQTNRYPLVTRLATVVMLVAFAWIHYRPDALPWNPNDLIFYPGNGAPWTALTALFLHGGWLHLVGNLIYFNVFGPPLEDRLGHGLFALVFLVLGAAGNLAHGAISVWGLLGAGGVGVLGASGALAGLMAFGLVRLPSARVRIGWWVFAPLAGQNRAGQSRLPMSLAVLLWVLLQATQALVAGETGATVSYGAHFGGFGVGLVLALLLGQRRLGRLESLQTAARRSFREGAYYPALGEWTEYLEMCPRDADALLERGRCLRLVQQNGRALGDYSRALGLLVRGEKWDEALEAYREIRRAGLANQLDPDTMASLAVQQEKQGDHAGAVETYRDLQRNYPAFSVGRRALVRLVHLYHGKMADQTQAAYWLAVACRTLPGGSWRDYLVREFKAEADPAAETSAVGGANPPGLRPGAGP